MAALNWMPALTELAGGPTGDGLKNLKGSWDMKCSKWSFTVVSALFALLLSLSAGTLNAREADLASRTFAASQTAKQQCINTCRARYRDCRRLNQLPSSECLAWVDL